MELVEYWFSHPKIWFLPDGEQKDRVNQELYELYGARWRELAEPIAAHEPTLENILYLDQLSRHFRQLEPELANTVITSNTALPLALSLLEHTSFGELLPEQQVFILLPLRHTGRLDMIDKAIEVVNQLRGNGGTGRNGISPPIYLRFLRASIMQRLKLLPLESPSAVAAAEWIGCLDEQTQERPGRFNFGVRLRKRDKVRKQLILPSTAVKVISLSGGVDSMLLSFLLKKMGHRVVLAHLVYGNRQESEQELAFICWWAQQIECPLYVRRVTELLRDQGDRTFYEEMTRTIRFAFYRQLLQHLEGGIILLGHMADDLHENFICNLFLGKDIKHGYRGMGSQDVQDGVPIARPLYWVTKDLIYECAEYYNIPFTKNTTPSWSRRGRLRNELFPLMQDIFGKRIFENMMNHSRFLELKMIDR